VLPGLRAVDEGLDQLRALALGEQHVPEARLPRPDERRDAQSVMRKRDQRERAHEPPPSVGRLDGKTTTLPVEAPPLEEPAVEHERARARHRVDEFVPLVAEARERVLRVHRLELQRRALPRRLENRCVLGDECGHGWVITPSGGVGRHGEKRHVPRA
jgi:hypothetical protein